ncbi:VCBS repeat-containing protein [Verrucomicrobia bacterium]|nr:VCBS repeat-containing protein [Verrucomicrobiota bacterium]
MTLDLPAAWKRHTIDNSSKGADGIRMKDIDGDGFLDITTGWEEGAVTRIYRNPGTVPEVRNAWPMVTVGKAPSVEDAVFVDLDGDGAIDVVSSCEGNQQAIRFHWAPKEKGSYWDPTKWKTTPLPASMKMTRWMFCLPMQVDGKNGIDLICGSKSPNGTIGVWVAPENARDLEGWKWEPLREAGWIMSLIKTDMDGDGDEDILFSDRKGPLSTCAWLANPGPDEALEYEWIEHPIGATGEEAMFCSTGDFNLDGMSDVVMGVRPNRIGLFYRECECGEDWKPEFITLPEDHGGAKAVSIGDINLDGLPDLVFSCERADGPKKGMSWISRDAKGNWVFHDISGSAGIKHDLVSLIDLDGDGDLDALTCEEREFNAIIWYENPTR